MQMYRQGDVLVQRIAQRPKTAKPVPRDQDRTILAYGEVTGHAHQIIADAADVDQAPPSMLVEAPDGTRYLLVDRPCALVHDEHDRIALSPGCYKISRQREYSPEAIRNVAD